MVEAPVVLLEIGGERYPVDLTTNLASFVFEEDEDKLDLFEITLLDPDISLIDHPKLLTGTEIRVRFGYADQLSPTHVGIVKEILPDFPEAGMPSVTIKAHDKGSLLVQEQVQRVWGGTSAGILASDVALQIAQEHGLTPVVTPTIDRLTHVHQARLSDAQFLRKLARQARASDGHGTTGYVFYVEANELHFHPPGLATPPVMVLEYFTAARGVLRAFRPEIKTHGDAQSGASATAAGVSDTHKAAVTTRADNVSTPDRHVLGPKTVTGNEDAPQGKIIIDADTGRRIAPPTPTHRLGGQRAGVITPVAGAQTRQAAEQSFAHGEFRQVTGVAVTIGLPNLRAKANVEFRGLGSRLSGIYHVKTVRHRIDAVSGYSCESSVERNALGRSQRTPATTGKRTTTTTTPTARSKPSRTVVEITADTGRTTRRLQ